MPPGGKEVGDAVRKVIDPCALCGKSLWEHRATTHQCPAGLKTRIGYIRYEEDNVYTKKEDKPKKKQKPDLYCLKNPVGELVLRTAETTKTEAWRNSFWEVVAVLGREWGKKYWHMNDASMKAAAKLGWTIVPLEAKELKP